MGWEVINEIRPAYQHFFNTILTENERIHCYDRFSTVIEQIKIIFDIDLKTDNLQRAIILRQNVDT